MPDYESLKQALCDAVRAAERASTAGEVKVGRAAQRAVWARLGRVAPDARRQERATTIQELADAAQTTTGALNRAIRTHSVAVVFGDQVKQLTLPAVRALTPLVKANGSSWQAKPKHEDAAIALVATAIEKSQSGFLVKQAVDQLLGRKPRQKATPPTRAQKTAALLKSLEPDELRELVGQLEPTFLAKLTRAARLTREPAPTVPIPDAPIDVKPVREAA